MAFSIEESPMFFHRKELMYDVKIQGADPRFGEMLLE
jgi:Mn-containing catalase